MRNDFSGPNSLDFNESKIKDPPAQSAFPFFFIFPGILVVFLFFVVTGSAEGVNRGDNLADAAEKLLRDIRETHYQHKTYVVQSAGIYDMDCSGFVDYLLKRVAPEQYVHLPIEPGHPRPRAAMYFALLNGLPDNRAPGWKPIGRLADAQRG